MKKIKADAVMFISGACGYGTIELLWRGRTHWSMLIAGGLCFSVFALIERKLRRSHLLYRCIVGSLSVTAIELIFGVVFNIILRRNVWDYSNVPLNFFGQICLLYSVLWGFLCIPFIPMAGWFYGILLGNTTEAKNEISEKNMG